jgi:hypothetical protein
MKNRTCSPSTKHRISKEVGDPAAPRRRGLARGLPAIACAALTSGIVLAAPAVAGASTPGPAARPAPRIAPSSGVGFSQLQKALEAELTARQDRLSILTAAVTSAKHLTSAHRSTLESDLAAETAGINWLAAKVPHDTTVAELAVDHEAMIDYRVFVVMSPQVKLTIIADSASAVEQRIENAEPRIEATIEYWHDHGKDTDGAQVAYRDLVRQVSNAENDTAGVASAVLATSPAQWPANRTIFTNGASSLRQARVALRTARSDLKTIATDLGL